MYDDDEETLGRQPSIIRLDYASSVIVYVGRGFLFVRSVMAWRAVVVANIKTMDEDRMPAIRPDFGRVFRRQSNGFRVSLHRR